MAFLGKNIIENLTTAMYEQLLIVYREYIQNSADSIDKAIAQGIIEKSNAEIDINIDSEKGNIIIKDNGLGISVNDFTKIMSSIADSSKDPSSNKGFRGIGRLGGISVCKSLRFECSFLGEPKKSVVVWDAKKIREVLNDSNQNPDASSLVDNKTEYFEECCESDEHFFTVEMLGIERSANELLNVEKVKEYLSAVAPLPYKTGFIFQKKIHDFAEENAFTIDEYNVFVNGDRLYKNYSGRLYEEKNGSKVCYDELIDVRFEKFYDSNDKCLAWMWYGVSRFEKAIPVCNSMRGIRLRKGNIQIGNEDTFYNQELFKESRGYQYFVGEVHAINPELRPNARRDYFNKNDICREFEMKLRPLFYDAFYAMYHHANQEKNDHKKLKELEDAKELYEKKTKAGFVNNDEKRKLEEDIENKTVAAEKAQKRIDSRNSKEETGTVMSQIYEAIQQQYEKTTSEYSVEDDTDKPDDLVDETQKNGKKKETHYLSDELSKLGKKERKVVQRIYGKLQAILPPDTAEWVINTLQEELKK